MLPAGDIHTDMRILLAEDDRFYANRLTELLSDHGLEVSLVGSTEEALRIDPSVYDSAILDMIMPNEPVASGITIEECRGGYMAGVALTRRIRKLKPGIKLTVCVYRPEPLARGTLLRRRG